MYTDEWIDGEMGMYIQPKGYIYIYRYNPKILNTRICVSFMIRTHARTHAHTYTRTNLLVYI